MSEADPAFLMAVIIAHPYWGERSGSDKRIASVAYHLADAMLAERDSPQLSQTESAHLGYGG